MRSYRRYGWRWELPNFDVPSKKWCLVKQCAECQRMCHYVHPMYEYSLRLKKKGQLISQPPRCIRWRFLDDAKADRICEECLRNLNTFSHVNECAFCGRVGRTNSSGVCYRPGTWEDYGRGCNLCVSCWNSYKALRSRAADIRAVDKLVREIRKEIRNVRDTEEGRQGICAVDG